MQSEVSSFSLDEFMSTKTAAYTNADLDVLSIEAALSKPRSRSLNTSDYTDAFFDLIPGIDDD